MKTWGFLTELGDIVIAGTLETSITQKKAMMSGDAKIRCSTIYCKDDIKQLYSYLQAVISIPISK